MELKPIIAQLMPLHRTLASDDMDIALQIVGQNMPGASNFTIENYGNGWYRVSCYNTLDVNLQIQIVFGVDSSGSNIATNGTDGVYIYGFELQNGSYATSYIPTSGSTATRQADVANGAGVANVFNDSEGVLYANVASVNDANYKFIGLSNGNGTNRLGLFIGPSNDKMSVESAGSGTDLGIYNKNIITENNNKIALKYKPNDCALWLNGFELGVDTSFAAFADGRTVEIAVERASTLVLPNCTVLKKLFAISVLVMFSAP